MTISASGRRALAAAARKRNRAGKLVMPSREIRRVNRDWPLHRVRVHHDGKARDADEARLTFASRPWAKRAVYLGVARDWHCWERPPEEP